MDREVRKLSSGAVPPRNFTTEIPGPVRCAFAAMLEAHRYAEQLHCDSWEFAIEMSSLTDLGVTTNDLRWMAYLKYVEHARDITGPQGEKREFQQTGRLTFSPETCFRLSPIGLELAQSLERGDWNGGKTTSELKARDEATAHESLTAHSPETPRAIPHWDGDRRELRVGGRLVKQFKVPSPNQETILMSFEEESWACRIDDPLPQVPDREPKQRLRDTIKSLNRHQKDCMIRFKGDGTGQGIIWDYDE